MAHKPTLRFAPSPNGELHLGHAYSALFTAERARLLEGRLLLRIEDIDWLRCKPAYTDQILEDLSWLGLTWEEPVRRQSEHLAAYTTALDRLDTLKLLYPCFCSRKQIAERARGTDPDGAPLYAGHCRLMTARERLKRMTAGEAYAMRLDMKKALVAAGEGLSFIEEGEGPNGETGRLTVAPERWGDVVLARKDIGTSYHMAVVVDDAVQGITHVTRGQDLFHATDVHRVLQSLLELPTPKYCHHRLIGDEAGRKLSKSAQDQSLRSLREAGVTAEEIRRTLIPIVYQSNDN